MNHATEGLLQAHLDGETGAGSAAELEEHLSSCAECRAALERLRADARILAAALAELDSHFSGAALEQAWWRVGRGGRRGVVRGRFALGALGRAAVLLLVLAGALAAIPGSPVRQLLAGISRGADAPAAAGESAAEPVAEPTPEQPAAAPAERAPLAGVGLIPAEGRVRVLIWSARPGAVIRVNLIEGSRVTVEAGSDADDVRFRTSNGRIEVMNLGGAEAVVRIPRSLPFASLDVDGRQWWFKDGDLVRVSGPVVEQGRDVVVFRSGS